MCPRTSSNYFDFIVFFFFPGSLNLRVIHRRFYFSVGPRNVRCWLRHFFFHSHTNIQNTDIPNIMRETQTYLKEKKHYIVPNKWRKNDRGNIIFIKEFHEIKFWATNAIIQWIWRNVAERIENSESTYSLNAPLTCSPPQIYSAKK